LYFAPKLKTSPFQCFFSTAFGYGTITVEGRKLSVGVIEGEMPIEKLVFTDAESTRTLDWKVTARPGVIATTSV
jgi:hypothetical protein